MNQALTLIGINRTIEQLAPELKSLAIYGGAGMEQQMRALRGRVDIVCATPGRLRDLMRRKHFVRSFKPCLTLSQLNF